MEGREVLIKKINKKTNYSAKVYKFLIQYGIKPRKKGDLPGEQEAYKLIKERKVFIKENYFRK